LKFYEFWKILIFGIFLVNDIRAYDIGYAI
jgi:hypothetical protein